MAMNINAPKATNWWLWGGAVAALIAIGVALWGFDVFGTDAGEDTAPAVEQSN